MIAYPVSFFALPLVIVILAIDSYLFLAGLWWLLGATSRAAAGHRNATFERFVEVPVQIAGAKLSRWYGRAVPAWLPWVIVIVSACAVRQVLVFILIRVS
jgi:hypothetical protein